MNCPRCKLPLVPGRLAEHSILEKVQVCASCKGTFIGPQDLHEVEIQHTAALFELRHVPDAIAQQVPLSCPACDITMLKVVSKRDAAVTMDYCPKCHHTWLDGGEIQAMQTESLLDNLVSLFRHLRR
ncbi:MAG: zf-TFIIB domain-containing protein [Minicystis sp.]